MLVYVSLLVGNHGLKAHWIQKWTSPRPERYHDKWGKMLRKSKMCYNSWETSQWHPFHRIFVHPPDPHLSHPWANRISAFHGLHFDDVVIHQTLHLIHCRTRHDVGLGILWRRDFPLGFVEGYGSWFYSWFFPHDAPQQKTSTMLRYLKKASYIINNERTHHASQHDSYTL